MTTFLALCLYALATGVLVGLAFLVAVAFCFEQPGILVLAVIFAAITAVLIGAGMAL